MYKTMETMNIIEKLNNNEDIMIAIILTILFFTIISFCIFRIITVIVNKMKFSKILTCAFYIIMGIILIILMCSFIITLIKIVL